MRRMAQEQRSSYVRRPGVAGNRSTRGGERAIEGVEFDSIAPCIRPTAADVALE